MARHPGVTPPSHDELVLALAGAQDETARRAMESAERLEQKGEELLRMSAMLKTRSEKLLQSTEALGYQVGETEVPEDVTVGRKGKVTMEVARNAAVQLGSFNVEHFAEELGLKKITARRWIARLREAAILDVTWDDEVGQIYEYVIDVGSGGPLPERRETPEQEAVRRERRDNGAPVPGTGRDRGSTSTVGQRRPGRQ